MAKVMFPFHVLYGGRLRSPNKPFEVPDSEVEKLVVQGGEPVETSSKMPEKALQRKR